MTAPIPVAVCGAAGRMGQRLVAAALAAEGVALAGALEAPGHRLLGADAGAVAGAGDAGVAIVARPEEIVRDVRVYVDFTTPAATLALVEHARRAGRAVVIGTTGFESDQRARIDAAAKEIPIVLASNMSTGVNVLFKLAADAARLLGPDYDVEIVELHHNKKKDAPSGTAMTIAERIAEATGRDLARDAVYGREGLVGERRKGEIGILAVRGGDIVGEHTVYYAGPGERLEMTIRSGSRDTYAGGAMRAARWLAGRPAGLYDMQDVLGLSA